MSALPAGRRAAVRCVAALLVIVVFITSVNAAERDPAQQQKTHSLVFGLTATELAIASGVGLGIGAAAAFATRGGLTALISRGTVAGIGLTTLIGLYVAHLFVEAVLVGGVYYYWPSGRSAEDQPSRSMKLRIDPAPRRPTGALSGASSSR